MWSQISSNKQKSLFLAVAMGGVLILTGFAGGAAFLGNGGGILGAAAAFILWAILALVSYYSGDKMILQISRAKKISHDDFPELFNAVEEMKIASGAPKMPDIYIIDDPSPNAFAAGRSPENCCIAVTSGLLSRVNREELQGVIAHEMSHIINRDVLFMTMLSIMLGAIVMIVDILFRGSMYGRRSSRSSGGGNAIEVIVAIVFMILAPLLAQLIYFAASRKREFLADACGARLTRYPEGLASALEKIGGYPQSVASANRVTAPLYIANPMAGKLKKASSLSATHPPIEERVRILRGMSGQFTFEAYERAFISNSKSGGRKLFSVADMKKNLFSGAGAGAKTPAPAAVAAGQAFTAPAGQPATARQQSFATRSKVNDVFWKSEGYRFIDCGCGVRLKVPPDLKSGVFYCPKCGAKHEV